MANPIDALQNLQNDLIRKALNGSVFIADHDAASIDEATLFDSGTGDLVEGVLSGLGYDDLGYLTDAGSAFARSISESQVTSFQSVTPTRSDTTSDVTTLQISAQETNVRSLGLYTATDQADLVPGSNGVLRIDKPPTPVSKQYRVLSVSVDETDAGEIVIARYLPNAKVTAFDNQNFAKGNDPVLWGVTFTGFVDAALGTAESYLFGGAGWLARLVAMGFTPAAPTVPFISGATPVALPTAGGTLVRINGRGFTGTVPTTGVKFMATNATSWDVVNDETIIAVAPAHAAGNGPIVVTNATGPSTTGPTVTYS